MSFTAHLPRFLVCLVLFPLWFFWYLLWRKSCRADSSTFHEASQLLTRTQWRSLWNPIRRFRIWALSGDTKSWTHQRLLPTRSDETILLRNELLRVTDSRWFHLESSHHFHNWDHLFSFPPFLFSLSFLMLVPRKWMNHVGRSLSWGGEGGGK